MSLAEQGIRCLRVPAHWAASRRCVIRGREELPALLGALARELPADAICGPPFCVFHFVSSVVEGLDVEPGYPLLAPLPSTTLSVRRFPELQLLALAHGGGGDAISGSYSTLYGGASRRGIVSQEFCREVYEEPNDAAAGPIEIQFVVHDWLALLAEHTERVLGPVRARELLVDRETLTIEALLSDRFAWIDRFMRRLNACAADDQVYEILSQCAHVFPSEMIARLGRVYHDARQRTGDGWQAVDAVVAFMNGTPGWSEGATRDGQRIRVRKGPRDPRGFAQAADPRARREAACFCPLIRTRLDGGMPESFCYCGAGWFRRQWEGAILRPVRVEIVKSLLRGDDACEFAVRLPDDL